LPVRPVQRCAQVILSSRGGCRPVEQEELAFDAEEFGPRPMFPTPVGAVDCLLNRCEPLGNPTRMTQGFRQLGDDETQIGIAFTEVIQAVAQVPHAVCESPL